MNLKKSISLFIFLLLALVVNTGLFAQGCAMCKTAPETDMANGGTIATGLNTGILYLMSIPYLILMIGTYFFFKKSIDAKVKNWKEKHFPSR